MNNGIRFELRNIGFGTQVNLLLKTEKMNSRHRNFSLLRKIKEKIENCT